MAMDNHRDNVSCDYTLHDEVEATPHTLHSKALACGIGCVLLVFVYAYHSIVDGGLDERLTEYASAKGHLSHLSSTSSAMRSAYASANEKLSSSSITRSASTTAKGDHRDVGMQCVSEFNWNQGQQATFKSASGYFVRQNGNMEFSDIPTCAGSWTANNETVTLKGNKQPRMFLKDGQNQLIMLDMTSEEVSWTQDVSNLGKMFVGAVYATWVKPEVEHNPAEAARLYCDANDGAGNNLWCPEMDLGEANYCGFKATSHPVTDLNAANWTSNAVNCYLPPVVEQGSWFDPHTWPNLGDQDYTYLFWCGQDIEGAQRFASVPMQSWTDHYGNSLYLTSASAYPACTGGPAHTLCSYGNGLTIDPNLEYDVNIKFDWDGYLRGFTTTLTQGSESVELTRRTTPNVASVPIDGGFPSSGRVALLVQLWAGGSDMSWLSGPTCHFSNGETSGFPSAADTTYTIKNLRITNPRTKSERRVTFRTVN